MQNELEKYNQMEAEALDSREVAAMVEKRHDHLLRDIAGYVADMEKSSALKSEDVNAPKSGEVGTAPKVGRLALLSYLRQVISLSQVHTVIAKVKLVPAT